MHGSLLRSFQLLLCLSSIILMSGCAHQMGGAGNSTYYDPDRYASRMPQNIAMGKEKVILVDPKSYAWAAYEPNGTLVRAGIATAGGETCEDEPGNCRTATGTFRIKSLGGEECYSHVYPRPHGGGLMPYCMFFHNGQALHGSPDSIVVESNVSHGCVRMRIPDAEWLRNNFAKVGTKVVVLPY